MLDMLTTSVDGVSFHVVAPSLPNFGWSGGIKQRGFALKGTSYSVPHRDRKSMLKLFVRIRRDEP